MRGVGRKLGLSLATIGVAGACLSLSASGSAAAIPAPSSADPAGTASQCTLRQAIDSANTDATPSGSNCTSGSGTDTISFAQSILPAHITLTAGALGLSTDITVQGPGAANQVVVDANGASRVLDITNANVTLSGLTVTGGHVNCPCAGPISGIYGGAGIRAFLTALPVPTVNLDHVAVTGNSVSTVFNGGTSPAGQAFGGGVLTNLHLVVSDSTISGNSLSATATGDVSTVTGALARATGAGIAYLPPGSDDPTPLQVDSSTISGNTASASASNSFTGGSFAETRGAITVFSGGTASVTSSTIANNTLNSSAVDGVTESGGGIYADSSPVSVTSDTITGNDAAFAANLHADFGSPMTLKNTIVADPVTGDNCSGVTSAGFNWSDDATCNPNGTSDVENTDPHLLGLGAFGGATQTRPPEPPAGTNPTVIDQGVAASQPADQRGLDRTVNYGIANPTGGDGTDVGSVEIQGATPTSTNPASPADSDSPNILGTSEPNSTVRLFDNSSCTLPVLATGSVATFGFTGINVPGPLDPDTATDFATQAQYGNSASECSTPITYQRRPALPTLTSTTPASGGDDGSPEITGTATSSSTVNLYTQSDCTGTVAGTGTGAALVSPGISVTVAPNSSTTFYAKATGVGGTSDCSTGITYQRRPALPTLTSTNPGSGADNNTPKLIGAATPSSTVSIY